MKKNTKEKRIGIIDGRMLAPKHLAQIGIFIAILVLLSASVGVVSAATITVQPGESIQEAINNLPDDGGIVELAPGIHEITDELYPPRQFVFTPYEDRIIDYSIIITKSNVTIRGSHDSIVKHYNNTLVCFFIPDLEPDPPLESITFSGFRTDTDYTSGRNVFILAMRVKNFLVENMYDEGYSRSYASVSHFEGYGSWNKMSEDVTYRNNIVHNSVIGIMFVRTALFENNELYYTPAGYLLNVDRNTYDVTVRNNYMIGGGYNMNLDVGHGYRVYNNTFAGESYGGLRISAHVRDALIYDNIITGSNEMGIQLFPQSECTNITIRNNLIIKNKKEGIRAQYTYWGMGGYGHYEILNNVICDNGRDGFCDTSEHWCIVNLANNIITNNLGYGINIVSGNPESTQSYNNVWNNEQGNYKGVSAGLGDIAAESVFANAANGNYHLKSTAGRWNGDGWVVDTEDSPCIDVGNPSFDYINEPSPNGSRINIGAYGNTKKASKSLSGCYTYKLVNPGESIQDAINGLCPSSSGTIELASGVHDVYDTIVINRSDVTIQGTHDSEIRSQDSSKHIFAIPHKDATSDEDWENMPVLKNFLFKGFKVTSAYGYVGNRNALVRAWNVENFTMEEILNYGHEWSIVAINPTGGGTTARSKDIFIKNNEVQYSSPLFCWSENIHVENNRFSGTHQSYAIDANRNNKYIYITGNYVSGGANGNLKVYSSQYWDIHDNIFAGGSQQGLVLDVAPKHADIYNNTITGATIAGILILPQTVISDITIRNNLIYNCAVGIEARHFSFGFSEQFSDADIINNVIYNNAGDGIQMLSEYVQLDIKNNIITNNGGYGINYMDTIEPTTIKYNDVWQNALGNYNYPSLGTDDISVEPLFADPANSDFYLKSQVGRWNGIAWVNDDLTSQCVDAGDPSSAYSKEPEPNGGRINIGAYGNTREASKSFSSEPEPGDVIMWDTNHIYDNKFYDFVAYADKDDWTHVPYGTTEDYICNGDAVIENEHFYLFLHSNPYDCVFLYPKRSSSYGSVNEIYKVYDSGLRYFGHGTNYTKILKNTPEEVIVEHAGINTKATPPINVVTIYRIPQKAWMEVKPVDRVNQQGMHDKSRLAAFVFQSASDDIILDADKHGDFIETVNPPAGCIGEINFNRGSCEFMWFLTFQPGIETSSLTYQTMDHPDCYWEWDCRCCVPRSVGQNFAYLGEKVVIGVLNFDDNWKREDVNQPISAGETYTSTFTAPYAGKWRVAAVFSDDDHYISENIREVTVNAGDHFTFTSTRDGTLEYVVMYMVDRTDATAEDITTIMDVYRETIGGGTPPAPDTIPPVVVTDLAASDHTTHSIELTWTAPGDDGNTGTASLYDIRYSTTEIFETNWNAATQCTGEPTPQVAGGAETFTVTGLAPNTTYYFALKTADEVPNWADISNCASERTTEESDLAAEWHLDDGNGTTAVDSSGNGNDGTLVNNPAWVTGKIGKALRFDGTDDYIDCGQESSLKITGAITVEAWVNWTGAGNPYLVTKTGGPSHRSFDLSGNEDGTVEFRVGGADCNTMKSSGTISIPAGEWVHLAGTYEPSSYVRLFVDGALAKENIVAIPASQGDNGLPWYIGAREGKEGWFNGTIDEVKIYNRALSAEEVRAEYEAGSTNQPPVADPNGPYTGMEGVPLHFKGNGSYDPDRTIVSYLWTFGDGNNATAVNPTHIYAQDGTYNVTLTVTDNDGATDTSITNATIADTEPAANFSATPTSGQEPLTVAFTDASASHDGIMTWEWDFDNDGVTDSTVQNPAYEYAEEGVYTVSLTVNESDGDSDSRTMVDYITVTEENNDLAAEWHLDDGNGTTAVDSSGNGNDGTLVNNPAWVTGKIGKALRFDGTNDYIDCCQESSLKITGAITVEAWVNWTGAGNPYLVTKTGGPSHRSFDLSGNEDGTVEFRVGGADCNTMKSSGTISIPAGEWVHLAGTYEPSSYVRLFVDGALAKENIVAIPASQGDNGLPWYIGAREGKEGWFNGTIDEVKIYNRALSAEEVRAEYEAGSTNQLPVADPNGPYTGMAGVPLHFKGNGSYDPDGTIVAYLWTFGDGNNATAVNPTHIYAQDGTYNVTLTVTDNDGATDTSITTATIADTEPAANFSATPTSGQEPLTVAFTDNSTSYDGIMTWEWDFDNDGVTDSTVQNPAYEYAEEGVYTVSLTVNESDGDSDSRTMVDYITVTEENNDLAAEWHLDAGNGTTAVDSSGNGNDGTLVNNPAWVTGKIGKALRFDGTDDYVDCGQESSLKITGAITVEAWVNWTGAGNPYLVTKTGGPSHRSYDLSGNEDGTVEFRVGGADCNTVKSSGTISTPTGEWVHLAGTYEPSSYVRLFVDGALAEENIVAIPASQGDNGLPWYIGAREGKEGWFNGTIDEVKIYNRALSAEEVRAEYEAGSTNQPPVSDPNGPYTGMEGVPLHFKGNSSYDPDGTIVSYLWTFGDGNNATAVNPTHIYAQDGTYNVTLTVTDNEGATDTSITTATIADIEPIADLSASPTSGKKPLTAAFTDNSTSYDGIMTWEWDFDNDGVTDSTVQNPAYEYAEEGVYTVSLTVNESDGDSDSRTMVDYITVTEENNDLAAEWHLDAGNGTTAVDSSGNGNDGTLVNNPAWVTGKIGKALSFDGTDDYVDCGQESSLKITGAITVEAWVNWTGAGNPYLVTKTGGPSHRSYDLSGNEDGTVEFRVGGADCNTVKSSGTISTPTGEWVHLAGTYEPSSYVRLFVDGALAEENIVAIPASQGDNGLPWYIGAREGKEGWFNGTIDEVKIYNRALSAEEVRAEYEAGSTNQPPVSDPNGPYTGMEGVPLHFKGNSSYDPDGTIVSYLWTFGDGNNATAVNPTHIYAQDGTYNVTLTVTDNEGATDTSITTATIADIEPIADLSASPTSGKKPLTAAFTDNSTSYDGIMTWEWDFDNDGVTDSTVQNPAYEYAEEGVYTVSLTVNESDGDSDTMTKTDYITVIRVNNLPVADPNGHYTGTEGVPIAYDGSGSYDTDGSIVAYEWDFGDGNTATGVIPTHTYVQDGTYTVALTATDNDGATNTNTTTATIADTGPTADFSATPTSGQKPLTVAFTDNSISHDGIETWKWDFNNDGVTDSTEQNPAYEYAEEGVYTVSLTVTESDGDSDTMTKTDYITVTEMNQIEYIWLEAEDADILTPDFELASDTSASNGEYIQIPEGVGFRAHDGEATYKISIITSGNYVVWGSKIAATKHDNSFFVQIDDDTKYLWTLALLDNWQWDAVNHWGSGGEFDPEIDPVIFNLSAGEHTLRIIQREDGAKLDKLLITNNMSYVPPYIEDTTPPASISNLQNSTGTTWVNWTWTNPTDADFSHTKVYLDGFLQTNTSAMYFNATGLIADTSFEIGTRTVDTTGNVNSTWVNQITKTLTVPNQPPVADLNGSYTGMEGVPILFNGNGSYDPDGFIVTYLWTVGDGKNVTGATPTHTYTQNGIYTVALTVTDNEGATNASTTTATIADTEPTADFSATPTSGEEPLTVAFTDNSASYDGIVAWDWDFDSDGATDSTTQNPTFVYAEEGLYTVSLIVTESDGDSDTKTKVDYIMVIRVNEPPEADPSGPYTGMEGVAIGYDGIGSYDSDGSIVAYEWDFGDGYTSSEVTPTHIYAQNGTYNVTLTVTDNDGATNTSTTTATIADTKPAANFSAMPTSGPEPLTVTFIDKSTSDDGIITWEWDFNNDGVTNSNVQNPTHVYAEDGVYSVSLTVNESDGDSDTTTKTDYITVTKANNPPVADPNGPYTGMEVVPILFNGSGSYDPDGSIVSYLWTFGDGNNATEATPTHTYTQNGTYTVTLTVTDNEGATDTSTTTADIEPDLIPPYTTGHSPAKDAIEVAKNTTIVVHVKDDGAGVDITSIVMTVSGIQVTPIITGTPADYTLTYVPSTDFEYGQIVNVTVDAHDLATAP